jgi:hypothetical protein
MVPSSFFIQKDGAEAGVEVETVGGVEVEDCAGWQDKVPEEPPEVVLAAAVCS